MNGLCIPSCIGAAQNMPDLYAELLDVAEGLRAASIEAALVGGLAYSIYVQPRATEDLDFLILPEDWEGCIAALASRGWRNFSGPIDLKKIRIRRLTKIVNEEVIVCDFLLADGELRGELGKGSRFKIGDGEIFLAQPELIVELKRRRMSEKDRGDIEGLEKFIHDRHLRNDAGGIQAPDRQGHDAARDDPKAP